MSDDASNKRKAIRAKVRIFGVLLTVFLGLAFGFLNCSDSKVRFSESQEKVTSTEGSGNGTNYDGKPATGTYYRLATNARCGPQIQIVGRIQVSESGIEFDSVRDQDCGTTRSRLEAHQLETSSYNPDLLGFGEGLFTRLEAPPSLDDRDVLLTETWCRAPAATSQSGLDVVVMADGAGERVRARVIQRKPGTDRVSPVTVQVDTVTGPILRTTAPSRLHYSAANFELTVTPPSLLSGTKWQGYAKLDLNGKRIETPLDCRTGGHLDQQSSPQPLSCPVQFIEVPALAGYTTRSVCIAKYEAKQSGQVAQIQPQGLPWMNLNRLVAQDACRALGASFDLPSNNEWQALARNIEAQSTNWSSGIVGVGALNEGQTNNDPQTALAATPDDEDACFGTNRTCSPSVWNQKRRTHVLSNAQLIWDVGGNAYEWVRDDNTVAYGPDDHLQAITDAPPYLAGAKQRFGPAGDYRDRTTAPWAGIGYGYLNHQDGAIVRGAGFDENKGAGIFQTSLWFQPTQTWPSIGFRCVYYP